MGGESSLNADALMRLLHKGTIVYTGTVAYVRLDAVRAAAESLESTCPLCKHKVHPDDDCQELNGTYDHLNGFHECGCPGPPLCEYDCSYCNPDEEKGELP